MFFFLWVNHTLGQGTGYYHIIFHLLYSEAVNNVRNRRSLVRRVHKRVFIDIVWKIHYELKYLPFSLRTLWLRVVLYFNNLITNILFIPYQFTKSSVTKRISPIYYLSLSITYLLNHFITIISFYLPENIKPFIFSGGIYFCLIFSGGIKKTSGMKWVKSKWLIFESIKLLKRLN